MPEISVLISVYNAENHIGQAIESIFSQSFSDFEIIIINDGSFDNTEIIIKEFKDKRIKYFYQKNQGVSKSLNRGLKIASGKYIAKLDADDICHSNRFEKQYKFMEENPSYTLCGSFTDVIDEDGEFIYTFNSLPTDNEEIKKQMEKKNCIVHSSSFYRRENALKIGGYYEPIKHYFEDYMFFYQLIKTGKAYNFPEPLIKYRLTPGSISSRAKNNKYDKLVLDVIKRGFIKEDEKKYLFSFRNKKAKKNIQLSNHYLVLSRLIFIHQTDFMKSFSLIIKATRSNPFNINILKSFFYMFIVKISYKIKNINN